MARLSRDIAPASAVGEAIRAYQAAVDEFDGELARLLGVNRTDLRALEILLIETPEASPSQLAAQLGLTSGSVTTMLDRLENRGYLTREPHPNDRRKTIVRATPRAGDRAHELLAPLLDDGRRELIPLYTDQQLATIIDFLQRNRDLQQRHVDRLRALPSEAGRRPPPYLG